MSEKPRITIGMPVYNGEQFLEPALQSALAQSFSDFELIVSDNGSTDRTPEICQAYAAGDPRIRYYREQINRGASWNFNRVFKLARADYFKWAAADDTFESVFLERCYEALEREPGAALAYTRAGAIDDQGGTVSEVDPGGYLDLTSDDPKVRFFQLMEVFRLAAKRVAGWKGLYLFGLVRSDVMRQTNLLGSYIGCDTVLVVQLILLGKFVEVPECLLFMRRHDKSYSWPQAEVSEKQEFFDPKRKERPAFPIWMRHKGFARSILRSPLSFRDRLALLRYVAKQTLRLRKDLRHEFVDGMEQRLRNSPFSRVCGPTRYKKSSPPARQQGPAGRR